MSNEDYREKIEEHRQSIDLAENQNSRMSRARRTVKKKNRKNPLLNILLFILLGIPSALLIYVFFFYTPSDTDVAEVEENGSVVEVQRNQTVSASGKEQEEPKIEDSGKEKSTAGPDAAEMEKQKAAEAAKQAEIESAKKAEQEKQKQEEVARQQQQQQLQQQQQQQQQPDKAVGGGQTHTVQPNENLFRIALKYYGDASGVDKIKAANNLSSNSISVGQTLIIP